MREPKLPALSGPEYPNNADGGQPTAISSYLSLELDQLDWRCADILERASSSGGLPLEVTDVQSHFLIRLVLKRLHEISTPAEQFARPAPFVQWGYSLTGLEDHTPPANSIVIDNRGISRDCPSRWRKAPGLRIQYLNARTRQAGADVGDLMNQRRWQTGDDLTRLDIDRSRSLPQDLHQAPWVSVTTLQGRWSACAKPPPAQPVSLPSTFERIRLQTPGHGKALSSTGTTIGSSASAAMNPTSVPCLPAHSNCT